jgi:hypothetical protein
VLDGLADKFFYLPLLGVVSSPMTATGALLWVWFPLGGTLASWPEVSLLLNYVLLIQS